MCETWDSLYKTTNTQFSSASYLLFSRTKCLQNSKTDFHAVITISAHIILCQDALVSHPTILTCRMNLSPLASTWTLSSDTVSVISTFRALTAL